jgi:DNA-binding MarR family transcriptional regulator
MSTIFHEGRKLLRKEVGNPNYAEIADFLYFRENVSKYTDSDHNRFFLLPNVEYISDEIGFGKTLVSTALTKLEDKDFIKKVKHKCYDGAVRIKIYITDKFKGIMKKIASLRTSNRAVNDDLPNDSDNGNLDSPQNDISDSPQKPISIIKEHDSKRKINMLEPVNFDLDFKDEDIAKLAQDNNVDPTCLFMNVLALKELNLFTDTEKLLDIAVQLCIANENPDYIVSSNIHYAKLYEAVDLERGRALTPSQHLYLSSMLSYVDTQLEYFHKAEVYKWVEFQLTNPDYHYQGRDFRHTCNIIKKALLSDNQKGYCKPIGFKEAA